MLLPSKGLLCNLIFNVCDFGSKSPHGGAPFLVGKVLVWKLTVYCYEVKERKLPKPKDKRISYPLSCVKSVKCFFKLSLVLSFFRNESRSTALDQSFGAGLGFSCYRSAWFALTLIPLPSCDSVCW